MSKAELVILDCWVSPFCARVKIALNEKGLQYEARPEDLLHAKSELLLNSNPIHKKVPVFLHDGNPVCESTIIVNYIDETWPSPPLLPPCSYGKAQARFWADYIDKKVYDACGKIWRSKGEVPAEAKTEFLDILKQLEGALGDKDYFIGNTFGFVDIIMIPLTSWFLAVEKFSGLSVADECPKLSSWTKRCLQRETVANVVADPEKVYEFVLMFRKMMGID